MCAIKPLMKLMLDASKLNVKKIDKYTWDEWGKFYGIKCSIRTNIDKY
jgi:hypothetical protein